MTQLSLLNLDPSRNRSRGSQTSADAHKRVISGKVDVYRQIYRLIEVLGPLTGKEISAELGKPFNAVSGRVSEMVIHLELLARTKDRRDGGAVLMIAKSWNGEADTL